MASDDVIQGYAQALFNIVRAEGQLDRVEDELFHFGKLLDANYELKRALSEGSIDRAQREKILDDLLEQKVSPHTLSLLKFIMDQGRARQLPQILEQVSHLAAEARESVVAEVRTAIALEPRQLEELAAALSKATGKKVTIKEILDPSVIGGIAAKVGDTVIDGTVRRRLEQLREQVNA